MKKFVKVVKVADGHYKKGDERYNIILTSALFKRFKNVFEATSIKEFARENGYEKVEPEEGK